VLRFLDLYHQILPYPVCPSSPLIINTRLLTFSSFSNGQCILHSKYHPHLFAIDSPCLPSHPCSISGFALLLPSYSLCLPYTKNERNGGQGRRAVRPERRIELVDMTSRYSFSDGEGSTRNGSYIRCVFHVLKPTPPSPTQPSISATLSARMTMASGPITTTPAKATKGGSTPENCIGSIKKWCVRRRRGSSSMASEVIGTSLYFRFFQAIL